MDLTAIIILIGIILLCVLCSILINRNIKKKKEEALADLYKLASEKDCTLSSPDYWTGNRSHTKIAIDPVKLWLFFIRKTNDQEAQTSIDLSGVRKVSLNNATRTAGEGKNKQTIIESVKMEISFREKDKPATYLEFYNNEYDSLQLSGELQLAEKWVSIVNKAIEK